MGKDRTLTVSTWTNSSDFKTQTRARASWSPRVIGIAGTLLLHSLVMQSALMGSRAHKVRPPEIQERAAALIKAHIKPEDSLVLIDLPTLAESPDESLDQLASDGRMNQDLPIKLISPDSLGAIDLMPVAISEQEVSESARDSGDGTDKARLFGIYSGQIQARIERIWQRPRTPINEGVNASAGVEEYFRCQVQIVQDAAGRVQEILLPNCNGSLAWQRSLVLAIQQASPLPAPPSPTVFTYKVNLTLTGYAYVAGSSDDGYEAAPRTAQDVMPSAHPGQIIPEPLPSVPGTALPRP